MARAKTRIFPPRSTGPTSLPDPPPRASVAQPSEDPPSASRPADRVGVPLTANGAIDLDAMRPNTRQRVLDAIRKTKITSETSTEVSPALRELAETAIGAVGLLSMLGARLAGYPEERAMVMVWTPSEVAMTRDPAARVLAKHQESLKYADEFMLASAALAIIGQKVQLLRAPATAIPPHVKPNGSDHTDEHHL